MGRHEQQARRERLTTKPNPPPPHHSSIPPCCIVTSHFLPIHLGDIGEHTLRSRSGTRDRISVLRTMDYSSYCQQCGGGGWGLFSRLLTHLEELLENQQSKWFWLNLQYTIIFFNINNEFGLRPCLSRLFLLLISDWLFSPSAFLCLRWHWRRLLDAILKVDSLSRQAWSLSDVYELFISW